MHRTLHTNKFLYKYVHALHHKYNSAETLSPWASIAFNPLDGVLQVIESWFGVLVMRSWKTAAQAVNSCLRRAAGRMPDHQLSVV